MLIQGSNRIVNFLCAKKKSKENETLQNISYGKFTNEKCNQINIL